MSLEIIVRRPPNVSNSFPTPLLFVHGAWHGAWCWDVHFLPYFAEKGFTAYAVSLRGHGQSEGKAGLRWHSLRGYVEDVVQAAEQIQREHGQRPFVIGHSMGGMVVQRYLERYAAPGGVLIASVPPRGILFGAFLRSLRDHPIPMLKFMLTLTPYHLVGTPELAQTQFFSASMPRQEVEHYFSQIQNESYRAILDMALFGLPRPGRVKTPVLVLGAADDAIITQYEVQQTAKTYQAPVEIFPDTAHDMMLEKDWMKVADRIIGWLTERG